VLNERGVEGVEELESEEGQKTEESKGRRKEGGREGGREGGSESE